MGLLRRNRDTADVEVVKGPSLARGPAHIVGTILVAFGLLGLVHHNAFPDLGTSFPDGTANGTTFLGFEVNGWTNWLCIAAGALLLFGAAQHVAARTMSLIVGLALAAAAIIAVQDGEDILGLAAANGWTKLGLGIAAAVLLVTALLPRTTRTVARDDRTVTDDAAVAPADRPRASAGRFDRDAERGPVVEREHAGQAVAGGAAGATAGAAAGEPTRVAPARDELGDSYATPPRDPGPSEARPATDAGTVTPGTRRSGGLMSRLRRS
jgi:hypothetical protein